MLYLVRLNNPLSRSLEKVLKLCSTEGVWAFVSSPCDITGRETGAVSCVSPVHSVKSKAFSDTAKDNKNILLDLLFSRVEVFAFDPVNIPLGEMLSADMPFWRRGDSFTLELCRHIFHDARKGKTEDGHPLDSRWLNTAAERVIAPLVELDYLCRAHLEEAREKGAKSQWNLYMRKAVWALMDEIWQDLR